MKILFLLASFLGWTQTLHPDFSFSSTDLALLFRGMRPETQALVRREPVRFLGLLSEVLATDPFFTILVDKQHALPSDYEPDDLVGLNAYGLTVSRNDLSLREAIMPQVLGMAAAARKAGAELVFSSAFRSYSHQKIIFSRYAARHGEERANRFSARAGQSQHQLGTTIDLGDITNAFAETRAGKWMFENAHRFGFSLSYPRGYEEETGYQWESWHWRYIGVTATTIQREYFGNLQHRFLEWFHKTRPLVEAAWKGRGP